MKLNLLSHFQQKGLVSLDFLLELKHSEQKGLGSRRASGNVNIDGNNTIATSHHRVRVMVVTPSVGAGSHRNNPSRFWHLIVDLTKGGCHFVGKSTGDDHNIGLTRRSSKDHTETFHIITGGSGVHHFDGATRQSKGHGPQGTLSCPVYQVVHTADGVFHIVLDWNLIQESLFQCIHAVKVTEL